MMTVQEQTATTANNLANVDTVGFKADLLRFVSAPSIHTWRIDDPTTTDETGRPLPEYIGLTNVGTMDTEIWRDFDQGQLVFTGNALDAAINGPGFFRVLDENGVEVYSRDGQFRRSSDGYLVDNQGRRVQGQAGDIFLADGAALGIARSGEVTVDGTVSGVIDLAYFSDPQQQLSKRGDNVWEALTPPDSVGDSELRGGYLERSNVDAVRCITELIVQLRHFQAAEKVIVTEDTLLNTAANQIGRMPQ
jgi:flagellar basal-body rod protein FlgG